VANRAPRPPGDYDLEGLLAEPGRPSAPAVGRRTRFLLAIAGLLLLPVGAQWAQHRRDQRDNLAPALRLSGELSELHNVEGDWIGIAEPTWPGASSATVAAEECPAIASRAGVKPGEILSIMSAGGTPLASCESASAHGTAQ